MSDGSVLSMWVVYDHPKDYPEGFIARRHEVVAGGSRPTDDTIKNADLALIQRELKMSGLYRLDRALNDDPCILEVWL